MLFKTFKLRGLKEPLWVDGDPLSLVAQVEIWSVVKVRVAVEGSGDLLLPDYG
jgi:hypothetical protein